MGYVHEPTGLATDQTIVDALILKNTGRKPTAEDLSLYFADRSTLSGLEKADYDELHGREQTMMGSEGEEEEDETAKAVREQRAEDEAKHRASTAKIQSATDHKERLLREEIARVKRRESTLTEENRAVTAELLEETRRRKKAITRRRSSSRKGTAGIH